MMNSVPAAAGGRQKKPPATLFARRHTFFEAVGPKAFFGMNSRHELLQLKPQKSPIAMSQFINQHAFQLNGSVESCSEPR
jgi:hypothetical protein